MDKLEISIRYGDADVYTLLLTLLERLKNDSAVY